MRNRLTRGDRSNDTAALTGALEFGAARDELRAVQRSFDAAATSDAQQEEVFESGL